MVYRQRHIISTVSAPPPHTAAAAPPPRRHFVQGGHLPRSVTSFSGPSGWPRCSARVDAGGGTRSARRRRERRLRSHLRHERMAVAMALAESTQHSAQRQKTARARERGTRCTARPRSGSASSPRGPGQHLCLRSLAGRLAFCGMHVVEHLSVLVLDVPVPQMIDQLPDIKQFFRALSPDPRAGYQSAQDPAFRCPHAQGRARTAAVRNSWWKCRRSYPILRCSGLWSTASTFQFLLVEDQVLVFKVFLDRVQQRCLPLRNSFLSGLWSRSLTLFSVDVVMVLSQDKVHLLLTLQLVLKNALMSLVKRFFELVPNLTKVRSWLRTRVRECPIHAGCSAGGRAYAGFHRVGAAQGRRRWRDLLLEQTYQTDRVAAAGRYLGRLGRNWG